MAWQRFTKVLAWASFAALAGLATTSSTAHAQKTINFTTTGSVTSTLVFSNQVSPDVYSFFAAAGEQIRLQTSNNGFDTTIRVIGPDASINLFDDDSGGGVASRLVFTAADSGAYIVVVSSFSGNPTSSGNYTLSFARGSAALQPLVAVSSSEPEPGASSPEVNNPIEEKP
jgi:Bacterial pre-peptidase C-terminal domain